MCREPASPSPSTAAPPARSGGTESRSNGPRDAGCSTSGCASGLPAGSSRSRAGEGRGDVARWVIVVVSGLLLAPAAGRGQACAEPHYRWSEKVDTTLQTRPAAPVDIAAILTAWAPLSLTSRDMCAPRAAREDSVFVLVGRSEERRAGRERES